MTRRGAAGSTGSVFHARATFRRAGELVTFLSLCVQALAWPARLHAQQAEQITVVPASSAAAPVSTTLLTGADIARSGASSLGALLDQVPSFGSQGVNGAQNDGGFGEYFIDLRNLNFDRTLVLVNGQRFVLSGIQTDEAVDLNNIPAAFVDHIEILRDGAQPQFGADAVAGAVNIVLKDQIEGVHVQTYGAAAGAGDAGTAGASLTAGRAFAGGQLAIGLDFLRRDPVLQGDRAWSADPIAAAALTQSGPRVQFGSVAAPGGHAMGDGIDALALGHGATRPFNPLTDSYDDAASRYLQGGLQRETAYFDADTSLTDSISANAELLYNDRSATTLQPPQTLGLGGTAKHPDGFEIPAADPFNPFGAPVTLERVVSEAGAQRTTTGGPVWRVLGGLDGMLGGWHWSASIDHGQSLSRYVTGNEIDLTRALQTAGEAPCPMASGCVAANWFGPGSLSPAARNYIAYTARSQSSYTETVGQARLAGPLVALPGGQARLTLGAEVRSERGATGVDEVTARGDQAGADAAPTSGGYDTAELSAALALPLLRGLPALRELGLSLAGRETATSRYGTFASFRAALDYSPVPGLHLRATAGAARRPPAISEAFGGVTALAQPVTDPCTQGSSLHANPIAAANCRAQGLPPGFTQAAPAVAVLSGGNPHLHPENSTDFMLGASLDPPAWSWLSASIDWYRYRVGNAIDSLEDTDPNFVPDTCYESQHLGSPLCALITRIPGGGNRGQIGSILGLDENVGTIETSGLEFGATVTLPPTRFGRLRLDWQTNWLMDYRLHTAGEPAAVQYGGTFPGLAGVGSYARVRSRATADVQRGPWSFGWTGRFISGARVLGSAPADLYTSAPGILYQDITAARAFGRLTAAAGIDNLADIRPPTLIDGETNTSTATYDVIGRLLWARVTCAF